MSAELFEKQKELLEQIRSGSNRVSYKFVPLKIDTGKFTVIFGVLQSAIKMDGIRWPVSNRIMQNIADSMGCMIMTPRMLDLRRKFAEKSINAIVNINSKIVALTPIRDYDKAVTKALGNVSNIKGIIDGEGKTWATVRYFETIENATYKNESSWNYGWHSSAAPIKPVTPGVENIWQNIAGAKSAQLHNLDHIDPSQCCYGLIMKECLIYANNQCRQIKLSELLTSDDDDYLNLVSHEGKITIARHPGVEELSQCVFPAIIDLDFQLG